MKYFFWSLIILFCILTLFFISKGVDNLDMTIEMYKRALDSGADAAARYRYYNSQEYVHGNGIGYGVGLEDENNIKINRDEALKWFYRLFFRNLSINDAAIQAKLKSYLPMKAIIGFDRLMIADVNDKWIYDKEYIINYAGKPYKFTLSDQIFDTSSGIWKKDEDIGLTTEQRQMLLTDYIIGELDSFLEARENIESGKHYRLVFSLDDVNDKKLSGISGVNIIVFCEGLPLPSYNPFKKERLYVYGLGGSELVRQ